MALPALNGLAAFLCLPDGKNLSFPDPRQPPAFLWTVNKCPHIHCRAIDFELVLITSDNLKHLKFRVEEAAALAFPTCVQCVPGTWAQRRVGPTVIGVGLNSEIRAVPQAHNGCMSDCDVTSYVWFLTLWDARHCTKVCVQLAPELWVIGFQYSEVCDNKGSGKCKCFSQSTRHKQTVKACNAWQPHFQSSFLSIEFNLKGILTAELLDFAGYMWVEKSVDLLCVS